MPEIGASAGLEHPRRCVGRSRRCVFRPLFGWLHTVHKKKVVVILPEAS